ncbi:hypothetical protein C2G38_2108579, partial [Gigaspora rosea]
MWEILYGKSVIEAILHGKYVSFKEENSELPFELQVYYGLRPHISENAARCYADLMKKCWHTEPEKRPTAAEICDIFMEWLNSEKILSELYESGKKDDESDKKNDESDKKEEFIIHDFVKFDKFKKIQLKYNIEWIPFNKLSNIETIGKGGFSTVYRAIWLDDEHGKQYVGHADYDKYDDDYYSMHESSKIVALKTITLNEFENHMK